MCVRYIQATMAVRLYTIRYYKFKLFNPLWSIPQILRFNSEQNDSLEKFVRELNEKNSEKWIKLKSLKTLKPQPIADMQPLRKIDNQVDNIEYQLIIALEHDDDELVSSLIEKAIADGISPSRHIIIDLLDYLISNCDSKLVGKLIETIREKDPEFYFKNQQFAIQKLELRWLDHPNMDEIVEDIGRIYIASQLDENLAAQMTRLIQKILRDAIENKGEASVVKLRQKCEEICEQIKDYQLLYDLWRKLFESFWFSDQQIANDMIATHPALRNLLAKQSSFLCFIYLRNNNAEFVNRLIQIFLQFSMRTQLVNCVKVLLDYECWRKNRENVLQIVQFCIKCDIDLSEKENKKFLNLLLLGPQEQHVKPASKINIPKYQYKF